jgi:uridine phosphorylase
LKRFFDPSRVLLKPADIVAAFTGKKTHELSLPSRAIIVFSSSDIQRITNNREAITIKAWLPFRTLYHIQGNSTIITKCTFGGPNIAALVEELSSFGVQEFILWGYCGSIQKNVKIGDIIVTKEALREDGASYHYLDSDKDLVESNWFEEWAFAQNAYNFLEGPIWSCDAIYRETEDKISRYEKRGILGVEMEIASFYAVCRYKQVKGIAFVVASDTFLDGVWKGGFHTKPFKEGVKKLTAFMLDRVIV